MREFGNDPKNYSLGKKLIIIKLTLPKQNDNQTGRTK